MLNIFENIIPKIQTVIVSKGQICVLSICNFAKNKKQKTKEKNKKKKKI